MFKCNFKKHIFIIPDRPQSHNVWKNHNSAGNCNCCCEGIEFWLVSPMLWHSSRMNPEKGYICQVAAWCRDIPPNMVPSPQRLLLIWHSPTPKIYKPMGCAIAEIELNICGEARQSLDQCPHWEPRMLICLTQRGAPKSCPEWEPAKPHQKKCSKALARSDPGLVTSEALLAGPVQGALQLGSGERWRANLYCIANRLG